MPILEILIAPHRLLKRKALRVERFDDELRRFIVDLIETMRVSRGYGLAAPQVGSNRRLFVLEMEPMERDTQAKSNVRPWVDRFGPAVAVINPVLLETQGPSLPYEEGCLSVPTVREIVHRPQRLRVHFQTGDGKEEELEAEGVLAVAIQHEIDHLDGKIFLDRLSSVKRHLYLNKLKKLKESGKTPPSTDSPGL